jgi:hypothetical protein
MLLAYLEYSDIRMTRLKFYAEQLTRYFRTVLTDSMACKHFWDVIPYVYSACDKNTTYERPFSTHAYAYCHFLERYWRTWEVLEELTRKMALPMGDRGIRVLDVGTGPGPTPHAVTDYYSAVRQFGENEQVSEFILQTPTIEVVEQSYAMNRFRWDFASFVLERSASCFGAGGFTEDDYKSVAPYVEKMGDFSSIDLQYERQTMCDDLRDEIDRAFPEGESWPPYMPSEAHDIAQAHGRYRLLVLSNFLTQESIVDDLESVLRQLFSDLNTGSCVLVIGASKGEKYKKVYDRLSEIMEESGLWQLREPSQEFGKKKNNEADSVIKSMQNTVYMNIEKIAGVMKLPRTASLSGPDREFTYPDYWEPLPSSKKRSGFGLRVFRNGKWPRQKQGTT